MANIRPEKQAAVAGLKEQLSSAKGAVLTGYRGLTVAQDMKLRAKLREAGVTYHVVKNTMVRIAANEIGLEGLDPVLNGTTALAVSADDAVAPAKVIYEFIKENKLENTEVLTIKAGLVEGKVINVEEVKALASLPSREVLIAKVLGSMQAPISGVVNVLQGTIRNAVYVLDAIREKENFEISEDDLNAECEKQLKNVPDSEKDSYKEIIKDNMQFEKVVPFLLENNKFKEGKKVSYTAYTNPSVKD